MELLTVSILVNAGLLTWFAVSYSQSNGPEARAKRLEEAEKVREVGVKAEQTLQKLTQLAYGFDFETLKISSNSPQRKQFMALGDAASQGARYVKEVTMNLQQRSLKLE